MSEGFFFKVRVYYEDTDAGGVVYNANYVKFLERARTEWLRARGAEQRAMLERGTGFVVSSMTVNFRKAARLDDELLVGCAPVKVGGASVVFRQDITDAAGNLYVAAEVKIVCVDLREMRPAVIPPEFKEVFLSESPK